MTLETHGEDSLIRALLVACWELEDSDGSWNGGDVVEVVCEVLNRAGLDFTHPANQEGGTGDVDDYDLEMLKAFARGEGVHPEPQCDCSDLVPGALLGLNDQDEIQRCDDCRRFQTDEQAAHVVAAKVGGRAVNVQDPDRTGGYWIVMVGDRLRVAGDGPSFTIVDEA